MPDASNANLPLPKRFYIVWNGAFSEGFVTDDFEDAQSARSGNKKLVSSTVGNDFFDLYCEDAEDRPDGCLPITTHDLELSIAASPPQSITELVAMLTSTDSQEGMTIFDHTPEEIGLHVMENHHDILAVLTATVPSPAANGALQQFLVTYGADSDLWLCQAENADHAREQCENARQLLPLERGSLLQKGGTVHG